MKKEVDKAKVKTIIKNIFLIGILVSLFVLYQKDIIKLPGKKENPVLVLEDQGVPIELEEVKREDMVVKRSYTGTIYPKETVELSFKMPGKITSLTVKEGDMVKQGQLIARLDGASLQASLNTIDTKVATIRTNLEYLQGEERKYAELLEGGAIAQSIHDNVVHEINVLEMQLKEIEAQKAEIKTNQNDLVLTTPIAGIVKKVNGSVGEVGGAGKPLVIIDYPRDAIVKISVSESDLDKLKPGTKAILTMTGVEKSIEAQITRIVPNMNPATRIGEVEIQNVNSEEGIIFGSSVHTEFILEEVEGQLSISQRAIKSLNDNEVVYKINGNQVEEVIIKTGIKVNDRVQIIEGLHEGDSLAIKNLDKLYDGAKIYIFKGE